MLYAVILAGGRGERFWPKSRRNRPKQILALISGKTMLDETLNRILPMVPHKNIVLVTTAELHSKMKSLLKDKIDFLLEPIGKNTAPAIAYTAFYLYRKDPDAMMMCLPADHYIKEKARFIKAMKRAVQIAEKGWLVTFGIKPTRPDTGYGYIEIGREIEKDVFRVKNFKEKPTKKRAVEFTKAGNFLWNSGMFVWRADAIIEEFKKHAPYIAEKLFDEKMEGEDLLDAYESFPAISVDYAVMEHSKRVAVLKEDFTWDDVGSWLSIERLIGRDKNGNAIAGKSFLKDSKNCIVSNDVGLTALLGVSELVVVNTGDVLFVCSKSHINRLKKFIGEMGEDKKMEKYL